MKAVVRGQRPLSPCVACSDPSPALASRKRAELGELVEVQGSKPVGVRELRTILAAHGALRRVVVVHARGGFSEGARALASALPLVVLCAP